MKPAIRFYYPVHSEYVILKDVKPLRSTILTSADDTGLSVKGIVTAPVILNSLNASHSFIFVYNLSAPVIVGCDFVFKYGMTLDFGNGTFNITTMMPNQRNLTHKINA